jgi:hypothetical protein
MALRDGVAIERGIVCQMADDELETGRWLAEHGWRCRGQRVDARSLGGHDLTEALARDDAWLAPELRRV